MWTPIDVVSALINEMSKRYGMIYVDYDDYHNGTKNRFKKNHLIGSKTLWKLRNYKDSNKIIK